MSEVLLKFAEPILDLSASREEIRLTLQFAMSIWNYTLLPEPVRSTPPNSLVELMKDPIERAEINLLIQRKAELFPENDRIFMDLEISETGSDFRLNVVSCEQAKPRE
jgi:hypothetical protein